MEDFLTHISKESYNLFPNVVFGVSLIVFLIIFKKIIETIYPKPIEEIRSIDVKLTDINSEIRKLNDKWDKILESYSKENLINQKEDLTGKIEEEQEELQYSFSSFPLELIKEEDKEEQNRIYYNYDEYVQKENERLEKILNNETLSFSDFYRLSLSPIYQKREIPIEKGFFHITELCGVDINHIKDHDKHIICKGVRKTDETIKLIKKDLKTEEILLEHTFEIYETSQKHIHKKFIVYHSFSDNNKRIRFLEKKLEGYINVEIDENGNPYVLTLQKNNKGNYSVERNRKNYEKYAIKKKVNISLF